MIKHIDRLIEFKTVFIRMILILLFSLSGIFSKIDSWSKMSNTILKIFDIHSDSIYKNENIRKYKEFKTKPGGILVFTHCSILDQYIIYKELNDVLKIVVREDTCVFPYNILSKRIGHIMVNKNSKASEKIKDFVNERKSDERMLMIAPAGGYSNNDNQNVLEEFKLGAFLPLTPILPVIIKYNPYINWKNGQSFINFLYELLSVDKKLYSFKVLDEVVPFENETPNEFRDRVKKYMENEMEKVNVIEDNLFCSNNFYNGNPILLVSSHLFLIAALVGFYFKNYKVAFSLIIVYLTSIYYHYNGSTKAYYFDLISNIILGTIFIYYYIFYPKQIKYAFIGIIIFIIYKYLKLNSKNKEFEDKDIKHMLFIHFPLFICFMMSHYEYQFLFNNK